MVEFLSTYSETWGMTPASVIASVFGAFAATFAVLICWPKLVKDFGAAGGILSAAFLIGTFWLLNHKLPGFGINPDQIKDASGHVQQFGLIYWESFKTKYAVIAFKCNVNIIIIIEVILVQYAVNFKHFIFFLCFTDVFIAFINICRNFHTSGRSRHNGSFFGYI